MSKITFSIKRYRQTLDQGKLVTEMGARAMTLGHDDWPTSTGVHAQSFREVLQETR